MEKAQHNAVLWFGEIMSRRLFRELGYNSINQYAQQGLGWSRTRTTDFIRLCQKLEALPEVKREVTEGELGYTKIREVVKVADAANEKEWLEVAKKESRRELEKQVKLARRRAADNRQGQPSLLPSSTADADSPPPSAVTFRFGLELSAEQQARFEALWERIHKLGGLPADRVEALLGVMAGYVALAENPIGAQAQNLPPRGGNPPVQIHVHQCPDCGKTTVQTNGGEVPLAESEAEKCACDALIHRPGQRSTTTIPPRVRREVLARDRHRCRRKGCGHAHFLEIHHIVPRSRGGSHQPDNLITLCSACHRLWHEKKMAAGEFLESAPCLP